MLKIKLIRTGKKNSPTYRIGAGEPSRIVEYLGVFNPQNNPPIFTVDKEKINSWIKKGAELTPAVGALLKGKYEAKAYVPNRSEGEETIAPEATAAPQSQEATPAPEKKPVAEEVKKEEPQEAPTSEEKPA